MLEVLWAVRYFDQALCRACAHVSFNVHWELALAWVDLVDLAALGPHCTGGRDKNIGQ